MGQELTKFAGEIPIVVGNSLTRMAIDVATDLQERALENEQRGGDEENQYLMGIGGEEEEEERAQSEPRYSGPWSDEHGQLFYYDLHEQAYFPFPSADEETGEKDGIQSGENRDSEEQKEETQAETSNPRRDDITTTQNNHTEIQEESETLPPPPMQTFEEIAATITGDLQTIYHNFTSTLSALLERGENLEETRKKVDEMMLTAPILRRQSRCLPCAQRCETLFPGRGFNLVMWTADKLPMFACCRGSHALLTSDSKEKQTNGGGGDLEKEEHTNNGTNNSNATDHQLGQHLE